MISEYESYERFHSEAGMLLGELKRGNHGTIMQLASYLKQPPFRYVSLRTGAGNTFADIDSLAESNPERIVAVARAKTTLSAIKMSELEKEIYVHPKCASVQDLREAFHFADKRSNELMALRYVKELKCRIGRRGRESAQRTLGVKDYTLIMHYKQGAFALADEQSRESIQNTEAAF